MQSTVCFPVAASGWLADQVDCTSVAKIGGGWQRLTLLDRVAYRPVPPESPFFFPSALLLPRTRRVSLLCQRFHFQDLASCLPCGERSLYDCGNRAHRHFFFCFRHFTISVYFRVFAMSVEHHFYLVSRLSVLCLFRDSLDDCISTDFCHGFFNRSRQFWPSYFPFLGKCGPRHETYCENCGKQIWQCPA